ncbi:MAG: DEAD/DEAH box helicase [archaeon]
MPLQEKKFVESRFIKPETVESRSYQVKLAESVLSGGNSLVVAPTALGKTIVAVLVASAMLEKEPGKKILFLAPTKPLCEQHMKTMQKLMTLEPESTILLTGSLASKKRAVQWEKAGIIIATPQTIENDLSNGRISLNGVSLIIFDEAHRAVGEYAYVYIAKKFRGKGLVLALTASPGSREAHIKEVCANLGIKNIEIKGLEDNDVAPYSHDIKVEWRTVELPEEFMAMKRLTEHFMQRQADILCKFGLSRTNSLRAFGKGRLIEMQNALHRRIAAAGGKNPSLFAAASAAAALMKASHAHTLLETQGVNALHSYLEREKNKEGKVSRATTLFLSSMEIVQVEELAKELCEKGVIHPKFGVLSEVLQQQFALRPESSAIVFNHYRDSIKRLSEELNKIPGIRAERFVGQAEKSGEKGMSQKEQAQKIEELKEGKLNCLVASSVAEEGLDIPSVDLVVFYEPVPSEIRLIQRRGRTGRLAAGRAVILMAKNTRDEVYYWTSVSKEKKMHKILHRMKSQNTAKKEDETENGNDSQTASENSTGKKESEDFIEDDLQKKAGREKQTTLHSFASEDPGKIIVYVDVRERDSGVAKMLQELGCEVVEKQLEVGDYVPGKEIAIERKSVSDFVSSIVDGRLGKQLISMAESYEKPLVIVEGNREKLFETNMHRNAIIGMLTSIALNYQVPMLFTDSARETAQYIFVIAKREQEGKGSDVRLRIGRKGLTLGEQQRFVVESLPMVGPKMARALLKKFGSVKGIVNAQSKELQEVDNMGQKKAKLVRQVLLTEYKEEE